MAKVVRDPLETVQRVSLAAVGAMWLSRAAQVALDPEVIQPEWAILHSLLPIWLRVTLWAVTGLGALVCVWRGHRNLGLGLVVIMPTERAVSYGWSALMWLWPGYPPGHLASLAWCAWWTLTTLLVIAPHVLPGAVMRCPRKRDDA